MKLGIWLHQNTAAESTLTGLPDLTDKLTSSIKINIIFKSFYEGSYCILSYFLSELRWESIQYASSLNVSHFWHTPGNTAYNAPINTQIYMMSMNTSLIQWLVLRYSLTVHWLHSGGAKNCLH